MRMIIRITICLIILGLLINSTSCKSGKDPLTPPFGEFNAEQLKTMAAGTKLKLLAVNQVQIDMAGQAINISPVRLGEEYGPPQSPYNITGKFVEFDNKANYSAHCVTSPSLSISESNDLRIEFSISLSANPTVDNIIGLLAPAQDDDNFTYWFAYQNEMDPNGPDYRFMRELVNRDGFIKYPVFPNADPTYNPFKYFGTVGQELNTQTFILELPSYDYPLQNFNLLILQDVSTAPGYQACALYCKDFGMDSTLVNENFWRIEPVAHGSSYWVTGEANFNEIILPPGWTITYEGVATLAYPQFGSQAYSLWVAPDFGYYEQNQATPFIALAYAPPIPEATVKVEIYVIGTLEGYGTVILETLTDFYKIPYVREPDHGYYIIGSIRNQGISLVNSETGEIVDVDGSSGPMTTFALTDKDTTEGRFRFVFDINATDIYYATVNDNASFNPYDPINPNNYITVVQVPDYTTGGTPHGRQFPDINSTTWPVGQQTGKTDVITFAEAWEPVPPGGTTYERIEAYFIDLPQDYKWIHDIQFDDIYTHAGDSAFNPQVSGVIGASSSNPYFIVAYTPLKAWGWGNGYNQWVGLAKLVYDSGQYSINGYAYIPEIGPGSSNPLFPRVNINEVGDLVVYEDFSMSYNKVFAAKLNTGEMTIESSDEYAGVDQFGGFKQYFPAVSGDGIPPPYTHYPGVVVFQDGESINTHVELGVRRNPQDPQGGFHNRHYDLSQGLSFGQYCGKPDLRVDRKEQSSRGAVVYATTDDKGEVIFVEIMIVENQSNNPIPNYNVYRLTDEGGFKMARMNGLIAYHPTMQFWD